MTSHKLAWGFPAASLCQTGVATSEGWSVSGVMTANSTEKDVLYDSLQQVVVHMLVQL